MEGQKNERAKKKKNPGIKGFGSIFQRKNNKLWVAKYRVEETGKYKFLYANSEKEAYGLLEEAFLLHKQGKLATGPQRKLNDYMLQWLEEVQKEKLRPSSYVKYRKIINSYINPSLGHIQLQKLTPQQVQSFYNKMRKEEKLAAKTVNSIHGVLHNALDNAVRWNLVARNVCDLVSPPKAVKPEIRPLTLEQAHKLLEAARGDRLEMVLTLALTTGMRRGELLALRWSDIDFKQQSLQVRRTVDYLAGYGGYVETEPKTAAGKRHIALPAFVVEMLTHHRVQQKEMRLKAGTEWQDKNLVFTGLDGNYLNPRYILKMFDRLLKEAGLPHMRFHDLRHSAATLLLSMGVHPKVVQEILGHSNISMTLDTYSHVLPSLQREAVDKWNGVFGGENNEDDKNAK